MNGADVISVVVPVYNIAPYIEKCVFSILQQTYSKIEIIMVDDGSTDGSDEILNRLAHEYANIKVIHQSNKGVTKARLAGVMAATGEWIGFVDGDDIIDPEMYEHLLSNALKYNVQISHCGYKMIFPSRVDYYYNTGCIKEQDKSTGLKDLIDGSFIEPSLWNKLYDRRLFQSLLRDGVLDKSFAQLEDLYWNFYLFKEADRSIYEDFCPYHYIVRKGSACISPINESKLRDPLIIFEIIKKQTIDYPDLHRVANRRLIAFLISVTTMEEEIDVSLISSYRFKARKALKKNIPELIRGNYSIRLKSLAVWAAFSPVTYSAVHNIYSKLKGTDKKYKIE